MITEYKKPKTLFYNSRDYQLTHCGCWGGGVNIRVWDHVGGGGGGGCKHETGCVSV